MKLIPYPPVNELATRADMHAETTMLRGEMAELRGELKTEMGELRTELKTEMGQLRADLTADMTQLRAEFTVLASATKTDILTAETRLDSRFEQRFSEAQSTSVRLFAASLTANAVAVVTALAL